MARATEVRGVQAVRNIQNPRVRVQFRNNGEAVAAGMDKLAELASAFEEDANKRLAADLSANLNASIAAAEFEAQRPDNATNAVQFFSDAADKAIAGMDLSGLPVEYRDAIIAEANEYKLKTAPRLLKFQADASLEADLLTDDKNFVVSESVARRHGQSRGTSVKDFNQAIANVVVDRTANLAATLAGNESREGIRDRAWAQGQEIWLGAIEERGMHDAAGAIESLQARIDDGTIQATDKTNDLMARLQKGVPSQSGIAAGDVAFARGRTHQERLDVLSGMGLSDEAYKTARAQLNARNKAEQQQKKDAEESARKGLSRTISQFARERRAAKIAGEPYPLMSNEHVAALEVHENEFTALGLDPSDVRDRYNERVVNDAELVSSDEALNELRAMSDGQLANTDLEQYELYLTEDDYATWKAKKAGVLADWQIPNPTGQVTAAGKGLDKDSRDGFQSKVWKAFSVLSAQKGGYGAITQQEFDAVLAQTAYAEVEGKWFGTEPLVDNTPEDAIDLVLSNGTTHEKNMMREAQYEAGKPTNNLNDDPATVYALYTLLMQGLGPTGDEADQLRQEVGE